MNTPYSETIIIGGGFYGCCLALLSKAAGHNMVILKAGPELLRRASYVNQALVHYGYHYRRIFLIAVRGAVNFSKFMENFRPAVVEGFT